MPVIVFITKPVDFPKDKLLNSWYAMKPIISFTILLLLTIWGNLSAAPYSLHKIDDRTYAAVVDPDNSSLQNALIVLAPNYVVVAGAQFANGVFAELNRLIAGITHLPVRYLILSHHQSQPLRDHDFPHGIEILTSQQTWNNLKSESPYRKNSVVAFEKGLTFYCGDRSLLMTVMEGGHSDNTIVVYIPEQAVLFTSDIFINDLSGFMASGNPRQWVKNLQILENLFSTKVIPGRGAVTGSEGVKKYRLQLQDFLTETLNHVERGDNIAKTIQSFSLSPDKMPPGFSRYHRENIEWAWRELSRTP